MLVAEYNMQTEWLSLSRQISADIFAGIHSVGGLADFHHCI
jgi:hypothetical protein